MTLIEEVVVKTHVRIAFLHAKYLKHRLLVCKNSWVIHVWLTRIFQEQNICYKTIETVANPHTVLIALAIEIGPYFPLSVNIGIKPIESVSFLHKESVSHILGMYSKQAVNNLVVDKWLGKEILPERQAIVLYLTWRYGQSWREMSKSTKQLIFRYLPYTEEAKHMVYSQSIEVLSLMLQSFMEPLCYGFFLRLG